MYLELQNTTIGYQKPLVNDMKAGLSLGEVCLLIGNNGIGKTTLIKSILNQIPILKGEIEIDRKKVSSNSTKAIAEKVAIVFSKSNIPSNYTTTDLISLGKFIHYPYYFELNKKDKKEIEDVIHQLELTEYKDLPLQKLSDGNLQKAFIGRAIVQNSPMIILDEPTTHLDEKNKIIILQILRKLAKEKNKLILFSSHDWRLAKEFSDKIWYLKNEQLYSGITEDILLQHQELSKPSFFYFNQNFVAPSIEAPDFEKEMLYSFLQKNFNSDMTNISFKFEKNFWTVKKGLKSSQFSNFSEIVNLLKNID